MEITSPQNHLGCDISANLGQRVKKICSSIRLSETELAKALGIKQSTFNKYLNERCDKLWRLLPKILELHPSVSREWLYFGEGEIFQNITAKTVTNEAALSHLFMQLQNCFIQIQNDFRRIENDVTCIKGIAEKHFSSGAHHPSGHLAGQELPTLHAVHTRNSSGNAPPSDPSLK